MIGKINKETGKNIQKNGGKKKGSESNENISKKKVFVTTTCEPIDFDVRPKK